MLNIRFEVDIPKNFDRKKYNEIVDKHLKKLSRLLVSMWQMRIGTFKNTGRKHSGYSTIASGRYLRSITTRVNDNEVEISPRGVGDYPDIIEYGYTSQRWPNLDRIKKWMGQRGINPRLSYLISKVIKEKGIKGREIYQFVLKHAPNRFNEFMQKAMDEYTKWDGQR